MCRYEHRLTHHLFMLLAFENWLDEQSKQETKGPVTKVNSLCSAASVVQQPVQPVTQTSDQQPQSAAADKKVGFGFEGPSISD